MAELNYNDVSRAVQDGTRNLQDRLQTISSMVSGQNNQTQLIDDVLAEVRQLKNSLSTVRGSMQQSSVQGSDQRMLILVNDTAEMKQRLMRIEEFCQQMSEYMQKRHDAEEEDNQYREAV